ncbi:ABC transporter G family member 23-like isoform X1 [Harmonia axyridis]|uniref:ABC transporter G family member 23-like isoform X1 n=2 Tax=Harmonia axyridis TaxID=115357 RepID=UPI001E275FBB|nr:ABC transporter G family member 23-like isoform X1 [Harmonia axyridis]
MGKMQQNAAVHIQDAYKSYDQKAVLENFCMTVPKGCIYGLLGSSGCGKTTLLSCVVGRKKFNSGDLWVLGGKPGTVGSGVPGPRVGFMPQDIALVGEFTVQDVMYYFGRLANKSDSEISTSFQELKQLLELPPDERCVKECSGGQQRRVSFAAALIHKPELLILDEPTVGVDPILREKIWNYLSELTHTQNTAVIITTHYIEETRQANLIGLLRGGKLLAEASPDELLRKFNTGNLEEVFLILSQKQEAGILDTTFKSTENDFNSNLSLETESEGNNRSMQILTQPKKEKKPKSLSTMTINLHRTKALFGKNWKQFYRNTSGLLFLLLFPLLEIFAFMIGIGREIKSIPIAIVNDENMNNICSGFTINGSAIPYGYINCHFYNLSCRFLTFLDDPMLDMIYVDSMSEAMSGIKHGKWVGAIHLSRNYTAASEERFNSGPDTTDDALDSSQIKTYLDMSNRQIGYTIKYKLLDLYMDFQKSIFNDCDFEKGFAENPINFFDPVYGIDGEHFTEYLLPGIVNTIAYFSGTLLTSQIILTDRLEGVWDRSAVAGVTAMEITITHFILQFLILLVQNLEIFAVAFLLFELTSVGSLFTLYSLIILEGINGMALGFWISIVSSNYTMANILTCGAFYPMILLCGVIWPLEAQPKIMQYISSLLPFTIPTQSFRNVFMKGWGLDHLEVLNGVGVGVLWLIFVVTLCIFKLKAVQ